jgi:hypothetical protein
MANIYEITRNLIQQRGKVKAATITADGFTKNVSVGHDGLFLHNLIDSLKYCDGIKFTGCIWFKSGSYAYIDKDGEGYYWNYVQVPEIPKELC